MKRIFLLLTMAVAVVVCTFAQNISGQPAIIRLASGDSLITDLMMGGVHPRLVDGEVVWRVGYDNEEHNFFIKDVTSIDLLTPEQSMAYAREALVKFYKAMDGDHWLKNTNWCSDKPISEWYGVTTLNRPYVWYLSLPDNNLKGELPDNGVLFGMGPMSGMYLLGNKISGPIPSDVKRNIQFQDIVLSSNQMTGQLPAELFKFPYMGRLWVNGNKMTGEIPTGIERLMDVIDDQLNLLDISGNDFSGKVPDAVVNHPRFSLKWPEIIPQGGHLTLPDIPGYQLSVTDLNGNAFNTSDIYKNNEYTLIFNYSSANGEFTDKLKKAYENYKSKGFEVLGMQPGDVELVNDYLHANNITWLNLDPQSFIKSVANYYLYLNFINLVGKDGNIVFTSLMDETGKMENIKGGSTRDQKVFDVLADKFGKVDFTPYTSTDYSRDGEVMTLQKASIGLGVDIVFMGNAFVDKDMGPGGRYEQKMHEAMEQFFAYEPFTSLRNRFNVYAVKAVSPNAELYDGTKQAITTDADAFDYAKKIPTLIPDRPLFVNLIYNSFNAGRSITYTYDDNSYLALDLNGVNRVINHEGGGHGIGRLMDEYAESVTSVAPQEVKDYYEKVWTERGDGANIDVHSDVTMTHWARFAADARYASEGLGAYEGGGTYAYGIYRPTWNSMMRYNGTPFNAPSREAIYKNVMKLSEGPDWVYDYETFVAFDENGRNEFAASKSQKARSKDAPEQKPKQDDDQLPLPPVQKQGTWQDAIKNPTKLQVLLVSTSK